jgi:Zn-finger protein
VICGIKKLIRKTHSEGRSILAYFDMHAHSKKKCVFVYGPHYPLHSSKYLKVRVFARLLAENMEMFRYKACKFREEKEKLSAARLVIAREFNIVNSFTIEASFHGFIDKERKIIEFTTELYELAGKQIALTLLDYLRITGKECTERIRHTLIKRYKNIKASEKFKQSTEVLTKRREGRTILIARNREPVTLKEIYEKIKEEIGQEEVSPEDSDSAESEAEPLTKEEEDKALKLVIDAVKEFANINILKTNLKKQPKRNKVVEHITAPTRNRLKSNMKEIHTFSKEELSDKYVRSIPSREILPFNAGHSQRMNSSNYSKVIHMEFPRRNRLKDTLSVNYWRYINNLLYSRTPRKKVNNLVAKASRQK